MGFAALYPSYDCCDCGVRWAEQRNPSITQQHGQTHDMIDLHLWRLARPGRALQRTAAAVGATCLTGKGWCRCGRVSKVQHKERRERF